MQGRGEKKATSPRPIKCQRGEENSGFSPKKWREKGQKEEQNSRGIPKKSRHQKMQVLGQGGEAQISDFWPQMQKKNKINPRGDLGRVRNSNWEREGESPGTGN